MIALKVVIPTAVHTPASAAVNGVALIARRRATEMVTIKTTASPNPLSSIVPCSVMYLASKIHQPFGRYYYRQMVARTARGDSTGALLCQFCASSIRKHEH